VAPGALTRGLLGPGKRDRLTTPLEDYSPRLACLLTVEDRVVCIRRTFIDAISAIGSAFWLIQLFRIRRAKELPASHPPAQADRGSMGNSGE
jgi:hypothetical protein